MSKPMCSKETCDKLTCMNISVPIIWVIGGPCSGKTVQCEKIVEKYGFMLLSTGDLLRNEAERNTERGRELNSTMTQKELVSNDIIIELLRYVIGTTIETSKGYLINGYPRNKQQGILFEKTITTVSLIMLFDVSEETMLNRMKETTKQRKDDTDEILKNRIEVYQNNKNSIFEQYSDTKLKIINAEGSVDDIFADVQFYLDPLINK